MKLNQLSLAMKMVMTGIFNHVSPISVGHLQDRASAIGKLEPISPVSPVHMDPDLDLVPARFSKEELIQNMDRVDREITMVEQQICKLRKKQVCTQGDAVVFQD